jgi:hypothetical protein
MNPVERNELRTRAWALLSHCGGLEETGQAPLARETRVIARAFLDALDQIEAEQSARVALQDRCETLQNIIGRAVYQAIPGG